MADTKSSVVRLPCPCGKPYYANGKCKQCEGRDYQTRLRAENPQLVRDRSRESARRLRKDIFDAYGHICRCCGETEEAFLQLDHVNGGGTLDQKAGISSYKLWRRLRKEGYPPGFQTLCAKCNLSKGNFGRCAHVGGRPTTTQKRARLSRWVLREQLIVAYGGRCECCQETEPLFMTIDHIGGWGSEHRRQVGTGDRLYYWLKKNGFPRDGLRLLCMNCNWATRYNAVCPHQTRQMSDGK